MGSNRRRLILLTLAAVAAGAAALGALAAVAVLEWGWYDVAANRQHFQPVHSALEQAMHASVRKHASGIKAPALASPELIRRGAAIYQAHCVACHGGPGVPQEVFGMGMQPVPGPLVDAARRWKAAEMYWIVRHGIKMSGMPAWEYHLGDADIWATVAFLAELPKLTPQAYSAQVAAAGHAAGPSASAPARPPDQQRGRVALTQYACQACHMIPGVTGSRVYVGPPLEGVASRVFIAGRLPNSADSMVAWIRNPQHTDPRTAMPMLGVSEQDAHDIAAYLQSLH
ncbi:c-type cytochrome [Pseudoduganella sp. LjRoot289]|uniref:c-type cytochrome n=1 Tax=Pseudoduganella sp. LjRoot289 TaxID=3342314 RepID=UPI003ECFCCA4